MRNPLLALTRPPPKRLIHRRDSAFEGPAMTRLLTLAVLLLMTAGVVRAQVGGVAIDADGLLTLKPISSKVSLRSVRKAAASLEGPLSEPVEIRYLSLRRLFADEEDRTRSTMGGLTRIQFVVADPEQQDILIAGPAEPFAEDATGRLVGATTGRPVVSFDALVEAFRHSQETIGCSIDPDPQRQQNLNEYLRRNSTPATASVVASRYKQMARVIGPQVIRVFGVPEDSATALTTIEADCLLKHIAIGRVPSGARNVKSQLAHLKLNGNSFQRWWFAAHYDSINADEDRLTFELSGPRLKVLAQDEVMGPNGQRIDALSTSASTQVFAKSCSAHMEAIARVHPPIAALQNVTDCIFAAALIRNEALTAKANFDPFDAATKIELEEPDWVPPKTVSSFATTKRLGSYMLGLVGGVVLNGDQGIRSTARGQGISTPIQPPAFETTFWSNGN